MKEVLESSEVLFAPDFDGVFRKSSPHVTRVAEATSRLLFTGKSKLGETIFDRTAKSLYPLQPIVEGSVDGSKEIIILLAGNGRDLRFEVLSERPPEHRELTFNDLISMGLNPDDVLCFGFGYRKKIDYLRESLSKGIDIISIENDPRNAIEVANLNADANGSSAVSYLLNNHSGGRSIKGLVRVGSLREIPFDLSRRLAPLPPPR
ncbi:MAG: hypothetical protein A2W22_04190 [Candidatus Levybacteria bacterium RBG_16_35_11]|nr:MAG: hypothetical protein A2W22_04190 [Candidatus Levybacteria bacterium RBG_16_35_11]